MNKLSAQLGFWSSFLGAVAFLLFVVLGMGGAVTAITILLCFFFRRGIKSLLKSGATDRLSLSGGK